MTVYTTVETAKGNGLDPSDYLSLPLIKLQYLGKTLPNALLKKFLPWSVQTQKIVMHLE